MKKKIIFGTLFLISFLTNTYAQTFSSAPSATAAPGWTTTSITRTLDVSGLPSNITTGALELLQVNLNLGAAGQYMDLGRYEFILTSPTGVATILLGVNNFYNGAGSNSSCKVDIKLRSANGVLKFPSEGTSASWEPWNIGYYKIRGWAADTTFNQRYNGLTGNGTWSITINCNSSSWTGLAFNRCDLVFGPPIIVVDKSTENSYDNCSTPFCLESGKVFIATNLGFLDGTTGAGAAHAASDPPLTAPNVGGVGSCTSWNGQKNNSAWFKFNPISTTASITVSGIKRSLQILGVTEGSKALCVASSWSVVSGGCPYDAVNATYVRCGVGYTPYNNGSIANMQLNMSNLTAGKTYYIVIDGVGGNESPFYIEMLNAAPCCVQPTLAVISQTNVVCKGASSGAATVSVTAGSGGAYTYTWIPSGGNAATATGLAAGDYTVRVGDGGCVSTKTLTITEPATTVTVSLTASTQTICSNSSTTLTPSGADTYTLTNGVQTFTTFPLVVSPTVTTTYSLTGTSLAGCLSTNSATTTITVNTTPTVALSSVSSATICSGNTTTITASGANTYTLTSATQTLTAHPFAVTPSVTTTYIISGTSTAGCLSNNTVTTTVTVNTTPTVALSSVSGPTICSGNTTTITASGANTYTLTSATQTLTAHPFVVTPSATTTYTVRGTSAEGCLSNNTFTTTVTVNITPTVALSSVSSPTICSGNTTTITASGANTYTLTSATQTVTAHPFAVTPSVTTTYTISGTSTAGCLSNNTVTTSITVNTSPTVAISAVSNSVLCSGSSTTITPTASPVGASSYTLTSSSQTLTVSPFVVNPNTTTTYTLSGTSADGCLSANTATTTITVNATPTVNIATNNLSLCSGNTLILPTVSGGTVIQWQGPNSFTSSIAQPTVTTSFSSTEAGTYSVTVAQTYGANTCTSSILPVNISLVLTASITVTNGPNQQLCNGSIINILPSGGSSYTLQPGGLSALNYTLNPTATSNYTLSGSAGSGCDGSTTFTVNVNPLPVVLAAASNSLICSGNASTLSASSGSVAADSYTWSANANSAVSSSVSVSPSSNTNYTVTGTIGATGCTSQATVNVNVNTTPTVSILSVSNSSICSNNSSIIAPTASPTSATSYTLQPGTLTGMSFTVSPLNTTTYTLTGTSADGCLSVNTATTEITVSTTPTVSILSVSNPSICSNNSSVITPTANPISAANYTLEPGTLTGTSFTVSPLSNTTYTLIGANADGCLSANTSTTEITVSTTPTVSVLSVSNSSICSNNSSVITPTASPSATSYTLEPGTLTGISFTVSPLSNTTYTLTGINADGCLSANTATTEITVSTTPTVSIISVSSPEICSGNSTTITPTGATTYTLATSTSTSTTVPFVLSPTVTTSYTLTGTSAQGCLSGNSAVTEVTVNITPTVTASSNPATTCLNGMVNLNAVSNATTITWVIGNGIDATNQNQSSVSFGASTLSVGTTYVYTVTVMSDENCPSAPATATVTVIDVPNANFDLSDLSICEGSSTATIGINVAQPGVAYDWSIGGISVSNTNPLTVPVSVTGSVGTVTVSVVSSLGTCTNSAIGTITITALPIVSLVNSTVESCPNTAAQLNVANPNSSYNYTWLFNGQTISSNSNISVNPLTQSNVGVYTVIVSDANGCTDTTSGSVNLKLCLGDVPEIFTPNGDGKNDEFVIKNIDSYPNNKLKIFNRWGNLVYQKDGYLNEFIGYANTGNSVGSSKLPVGTYYVILDYGDNKTETYNGYLLLQY